MKLHEKAKELGVKSTDLIKFLNDSGEEVKSPNQELTDNQLQMSDIMVTMPASQTFSGKSRTVISVCFGEDNKLQLLRLKINDNGHVELLEKLEEKDLPSKTQMFAHAEYIVSKVELGNYNVD